MRGGTSSELER